MKIDAKALARTIVGLSQELPESRQQELAEAIVHLLSARGQLKLLRRLPGLLREAQAVRGSHVPVTVTVPGRYAAEDLSSLQESLAEALQKEIALTHRTDDRLIGGVRIAFLDERFDASLLSTLERAGRMLALPVH